MDTTNKIIITVDEDIDPKDPDMVMWAMSFAMQPHRDAQIVTGKSPLLDPSAYALMSDPEERFFPPPVGCSGLLIDATRKGKYPPVGLPKKEFMERALEIWREEEMPELKLRDPWYGYPLGLWTARGRRNRRGRGARRLFLCSQEIERILTVAKRKTSYEVWLDEEGIPVVDGYGVDGRHAICALKPWQRTGGRGAYIDLKGMEGFTGMYVGEIPPGGALNPEHHLYEELIYIIQGIGATELWSAGDEKRKMHFEWQQGSLFAIPLNTRHRMINGSREPAFFLAVTSAPLMIDLLHNIPFVMGSDYKFGDRFDGESNYFVPTNSRKEIGGFINWETNFIADARGALVDPSEAKGYRRQDYLLRHGRQHAGRPYRRMARRPLSQSALSSRRGDSFDSALRGLHAHVAAGSGDCVPINRDTRIRL